VKFTFAKKYGKNRAKLHATINSSLRLTYLRQRRRVASANISWYSTGHGHIEQTAVSNRNTDKNWDLQ